jgi:hypothetical protein
MKGLMKSGVIALFVFAFSFIIIEGDAWATSQFAKKYGLACTSCHTLFPRLNFMGEKFMRDGYQFDQDGNDNKQEINSRLFVDELKHLFGIRLNVRAVEYKTNGINKGNKGVQEKESSLSFGETSWVQFFVAGSIYKNVSIFIENEINDDGEAHFSWYKLGFHNLFGPQGAANLVIGQQAPMEWMPNSGRLRVIPDGENLAWGPSASAGNGEDSVSIKGSRPGISFYGIQGPVVYFAGVGPGDKAGAGTDHTIDDANNKINYWFGGKMEATEGEFEGSSFAVFAMMGTDTLDTATNQIKNDFTRYSVQALGRMGDTELSASYTFGDDDNWELVNGAGAAALKAAGLSNEQEFSAIFLQAAHQFGADKEYYAAIRYEDLDYDDDTRDESVDGQKLGLSLFYTPMENLKIGYTAILDLEDHDDVMKSGVNYGNSHHGDERANTHHITIRTMF